MMTRKEYMETIVRPMQVKANNQLIDRVADLLNDWRIQYLSGELTREEFDSKTRTLDQRLIDLCQVQIEEV